MRRRYKFTKLGASRPTVISSVGSFKYTSWDVEAQTLYEIIKQHDPGVMMITKMSWDYIYDVDDEAIVTIALSIESCNYRVELVPTSNTLRRY